MLASVIITIFLAQAPFQVRSYEYNGIYIPDPVTCNRFNPTGCPTNPARISLRSLAMPLSTHAKNHAPLAKKDVCVLTGIPEHDLSDSTIKRPIMDYRSRPLDID
ncbi:hypothetical protein H4Q26_016663 [Puccinia striiformis f. sp. tritici PST-130]|nr:hypothetical protein H4Q26_016663 [Puccinia striiformis f. sp. tritici PST-130]